MGASGTTIDQLTVSWGALTAQLTESLTEESPKEVMNTA